MSSSARGGCTAVRLGQRARGTSADAKRKAFQMTVKKSSDRVIVRSTNAGVFLGRLVSRVGDSVTLSDTRRLWYWDGAATLSELATEGVSRPKSCKFPVATEGPHTILGVIEIIPTTERACTSIDAVPVWSSK